ncbi:hypothetical protein GJA_4003 [Janthinobacterium agaricidamnosum NBRC 102515 = DSM 9628]|uniref:Uncharacterized protein n=2 Tax=Janthinobacterium agaricidamnosum TaxID=55508 RepID=W0V711_9BURK|nr:hypothetical protein GJA_4003 [Janthinobacterium agaricidamnosum NBRC 102515 = DSM 9628]
MTGVARKCAAQPVQRPDACRCRTIARSTGRPLGVSSRPRFPGQNAAGDGSHTVIRIKTIVPREAGRGNWPPDPRRINAVFSKDVIILKILNKNNFQKRFILCWK